MTATPHWDLDPAENYHRLKDLHWKSVTFLPSPPDPKFPVGEISKNLRLDPLHRCILGTYWRACSITSDLSVPSPFAAAPTPPMFTLQRWDLHNQQVASLSSVLRWASFLSRAHPFFICRKFLLSCDYDMSTSYCSRNKAQKHNLCY